MSTYLEKVREWSATTSAFFFFKLAEHENIQIVFLKYDSSQIAITKNF